MVGGGNTAPGFAPLYKSQKELHSLRGGKTLPPPVVRPTLLNRSIHIKEHQLLLI